MDTVVDWCSLSEASIFATLFRSRPPQLSDPCYRSAVWCLMILLNANCAFSNTGVDRNQKMNFI